MTSGIGRFRGRIKPDSSDKVSEERKISAADTDIDIDYEISALLDSQPASNDFTLFGNYNDAVNQSFPSIMNDKNISFSFGFESLPSEDLFSLPEMHSAIDESDTGTEIQISAIQNRTSNEPFRPDLLLKESNAFGNSDNLKSSDREPGVFLSNQMPTCGHDLQEINATADVCNHLSDQSQEVSTKNISPNSPDGVVRPSFDVSNNQEMNKKSLISLPNYVHPSVSNQSTKNSSSNTSAVICSNHNDKPLTQETISTNDRKSEPTPHVVNQELINSQTYRPSSLSSDTSVIRTSSVNIRVTNTSVPSKKPEIDRGLIPLETLKKSLMTSAGSHLTSSVSSDTSFIRKSAVNDLVNKKPAVDLHPSQTLNISQKASAGPHLALSALSDSPFNKTSSVKDFEDFPIADKNAPTVKAMNTEDLTMPKLSNLPASVTPSVNNRKMGISAIAVDACTYIPGETSSAKPAFNANGIITNIDDPKPVTPIPNTCAKQSSFPHSFTDEKRALNDIVHTSIEDQIEADDKQVSGSPSTSPNEDSSFELANVQFREDIGRLNDIQIHGVSELVNIRVKLCTLESLILSHHSSFDDVTEEVQLLLSEANDLHSVHF